MWSIDETHQKIDTVRGMPLGTARTAAAEHIVRTLEKEGPAPALPAAYLALIEAYVFGQPTPASFAVFSKLLRLWDTHPEYFDAETTNVLFWQFKWIVGDMAAYPQISQAQARGLLDEMRRRYRLAGLGDTAPDRAEYMWAAHLGRDEEAEEWRARWLSHGEDEMDCGSCKHGGILRDYVSDGDFERAVEMGPPTEDLCNREPSSSHRQLAIAYLHLGRGEDAGRHLLRAQATSDQYDPDDLGVEFEILARGGLLERAFALLAEQGRRALALGGDPGDNRNFLRYLVAGLAWALEEHGDMPTGLPPYRAQGKGPGENQKNNPKTDVSRETLRELYDWALTEARPLSEAFDRRAENTRFTENLDDATGAPALAPLVLPSGAGGPGTSAAPAPSSPQPLTGGAAVLSEPADPVLAEAENLLGAGDFAGAFTLLAGQDADPAYLVETVRLWCLAAEKTGRLDEVVDAASLALERAEQALTVTDSGPQNQASLLLFLTAQELTGRLIAAGDPAGEPVEALLGELATTYLELGYPRRAGALRVLIGEVEQERGNFEAAIQAFLAARDIFKDAHLPTSAAAALDSALETLRATGQEHRVEELIEGLL